MRKSFEFVCEIVYRDGTEETRYLTVHASNEDKAREFFKRDICNLKYCYEHQLKNIRKA